jgi:hypothetical protein
MKSIMKSILGLQMTAMFLTAALAGSAPAKKEVPFKGFVQAVESYVVQLPPAVQFPTLFVDTTGSGVATHLGLFTVTWEFTVNLDNGAGIGSAHFTAANGDSVFTESLGQGNPTEEDPDVSFIVEEHTITGGTGRFAGATGSFTLERLVNTETGNTAGSFNGTIVIHNAQ